ncbi:MAG: hypothetical protein ACK4S4_00550 [Pyrinomonadaceae bacterium]
MSNDELRAESAWHIKESERLLAGMRELRANALECGRDREAIELLEQASRLESDAESHRYQSRILMAACRPSPAQFGGHGAVSDH